VPIIKADARVAPNLRVGYVRGFDYSLPNALNALGVESKELSVDEVKTADLQKYSTLIVDNRVYESQPELITANQNLLDYAKDGGTLIVFYHKSNEWNPDERRNRPQLAPYKLILGDQRITDETAPITFLEPQHPLLNIPNKLGQDDFANWIQERGLYYPRDWDPQFHALLQSNDPGEAPLKGGLLVADYGRGHYIRTSMVWYRQLRAGDRGSVGTLDDQQNALRAAELRNLVDEEPLQLGDASQLVQTHAGVCETLERRAKVRVAGEVRGLALERQSPSARLADPRRHDRAVRVDLVEVASSQALVAQRCDALHEQRRRPRPRGSPPARRPDVRSTDWSTGSSPSLAKCCSVLQRRSRTVAVNRG